MVMIYKTYQIAIYFINIKNKDNNLKNHKDKNNTHQYKNYTNVIEWLFTSHIITY
ncbi:hypothetical protein GCM10007987_28420 [Aliivibrio fischeri]|nr:hypothetical protein GCM10007987_28420 [Aliivibrio fischeri]